MIDDHPLSNPTSDQLEELERATVELDFHSETIVTTTPAPNQVALALPHTNRIGDWLQWLKVYFQKRETEMEAMPFWRDLAAPLAVVSSALLVAVLFIYGLFQFNNISPRIQFYYDAIQGLWEQADKIVILFLPVVLLVIDTLILRFIYDIFRYDRRLSRVLSWVLSILNLLAIIAIGQIYSLI